MNEIASKNGLELLTYQGSKLRNLITEIVQCCEDRKLYESRKFGLPYAQLKCLMLFDGLKYLTAKDIAQKLDVAKSRVTKILNGLTQKGLIKQIDDPGDGRVRLISLTPSGQEKSDEIASFQLEIHRKILSEMAADERKSLLAYLELLRSTMEIVKEQLV